MVAENETFRKLLVGGDHVAGCGPRAGASTGLAPRVGGFTSREHTRSTLSWTRVAGTWPPRRRFNSDRRDRRGLWPPRRRFMHEVDVRRVAGNRAHPRRHFQLRDLAVKKKLPPVAGTWPPRGHFNAKRRASDYLGTTSREPGPRAGVSTRPAHEFKRLGGILHLGSRTRLDCAFGRRAGAFE